MSIHLKENEILVLKTVDSKGKAFFNGFQYPLEVGSVVTAPDWDSTLECGHGLHGLPWGEGDPGYLSTNSSALWILIAVNTKIDYILFADKCKFRSGRIEFVGNRIETINELQKYAPVTARINFSNQIGSDNAIQVAGSMSTQASEHWSTQTAGSYSTQKAGVHSTQIACHNSIQTAGSYSTQKADNEANQTAELNSTQKSGSYSTQKAGDYSTQTAGNDSIQIAGCHSDQIAGAMSTQMTGNYSVQKTGNWSVQTAGIDTVQICRYYSDPYIKTCTRIITKKEANKPYLFKDGIWTEVKG